MTLYAKNELADLTADQRRAIGMLMETRENEQA